MKLKMKSVKKKIVLKNEGREEKKVSIQAATMYKMIYQVTFVALQRVAKRKTHTKDECSS
jgi:hypothetical protein